jgi:hypothetical protein
MVDKTAFDGGLDPVAYERIGAVFAEARAKRAHFGHQPVYEVGLYFSSRTRDWFARENPNRYFQSFQGAHRACVLEHLPFGVLLDENLSLEALQQFPVVCLPNAAILSEREIGLFKRYVENGGKLLVTGHSGQFDRMGKPLPESALSALIGARVKGRLASADNWVRLAEGVEALKGSSVKAEPTASPVQRLNGSTLQRLTNGTPPAWPFLVEGPATIYEPTTAATFGELLKPHRTTRQLAGKETTDWPMSADAPVGPAILVNRIGQGAVLTFASSPDFATASEHPIVEARRLFRNAVRLLHPDPLLVIDAPANVEAVVTDDPGARLLRVHLLAYNSTPQTTPARERPHVLPGLIEDAPMFRVALTSHRPLKNAKSRNQTTLLKRRGQRVEATIADIHEIILLHYMPGVPD